MRLYPRDYLAWCFDGADRELTAAMKDKHYDLALDERAYYQGLVDNYYAEELVKIASVYMAYEFEPVPRYQRDTDRITTLLGVLS